MSLIRFEVVDGVATLTLDYPQRKNALSTEMRVGIVAAIERIRADPDIGAVVLTGAGGDFSAGGDISAMHELTPSSVRQRLLDAHRWLEQLMNLDRPVIAAVDGAAFGAGFGLALAADFVLASDRARFCMAFARIGLAPDFGVFYTLPRVVGLQRAKEIIYSAREITANEAKALGLVLEVVPVERLLPRAREIARGLAQGSQVAFGLTKRILNRAFETDPSTLFELEADAQGVAMSTDYFREAIARFGRKEPPLLHWPAAPTED
ncbi:MAG: enoyl-CoA hydratase/isomerase family protein [Gammaproteobacteria bacterium]|nr:enoyl-CoA hydratase/isomerase family protein [Gammaproteobacteria bacterium]